MSNFWSSTILDGGPKAKTSKQKKIFEMQA